MNHLQTFQVFPKTPEKLAFLEELSRNLWWCWEPSAIELFRRINPRRWDKVGRNPVKFLSGISQDRLAELAEDDGFLAHQGRVVQRFKARVKTPADRIELFDSQDVIAYFSMEFGIHESIPLFAGGLGVLAGDHLKAASNLALPLVGIGLLYRQGYFRQFLDHEGNQQEDYPATELHYLPLERARDARGEELTISVPGPDGEFLAAVWRLNVGRIALYLLDANLAENPPDVRDYTSKLYVGDQKVRLTQEVLLGIGGIRALSALGLNPKVSHMNEGHSAFSSLQRLAWFMTHYGIDLQTALEIVPRTTIFTTHTPVPAGHDEFPPHMVQPVLKAFEEPLGVSEKQILSWGQMAGSGAEGPLSMFVLGLRMAQHLNGVSRLHGKVARKMWAPVWPQKPVEEVPISHITNGIHISTWLSPANGLLFARYLGPEWYMGSRKPEQIDRIDEIYAEELWSGREMSRARLITACRDRMVKQYSWRNAPAGMVEEAATVLDRDVLTIGFARRFATYKRATLVLHDPERLKAILNSEDRPVQIIFAGKAHPRDDEGKEYIRRIIEFARDPDVRHRIVFLEDYDMELARYMVQGVDLWLNTPRRPFEACGTSGMKAAVNGVLNLSIRDGWWAEAYTQEVGWAIGAKANAKGESAFQDALDAHSLYNVLENEILPAFYERKNGSAPARWVKMMKASMKMAMADFCSMRMAGEYNQKYYLPAAQRFDALVKENCAEAGRLAALEKHLRSQWNNIHIEQPVHKGTGAFRVGDTFKITTSVYLGELSPDDVEIQLYFGQLKSVDAVTSGNTIPMSVESSDDNGRYVYTCLFTCNTAGHQGFTVRAVPRGDDYIRELPGLITWA
jgi:glycogen phosphorylase